MTRRSGRAVLAAALTLVPGPVLAEDGRLQPNFTFRSVMAPGATSGPRITVQIDPDAPSAIRAGDSNFRGGAINTPAEPAAMPVAAPGPAPAGRRAAYDWFWGLVSPAIGDTGPGRLDAALRALGQAPDGGEVRAPRLQAMQELAAAHGPTILMETVGTRVSPALVLAVISIESGGRASAESPAGALGLMQLMPATAERFGVTDRASPAQSIRGGVAYLDWLLEHFDGDPVLALAGYNAGEGAVRSNDGVPPYAETRDYVPKVLAAFAVARGLCRTPPVLISDGCVFVGST
ncbi:lytic transglycosylase domain-containing protein [Wenxinia saemankumensis]|uniref:Soluble lytic murein transglycosylase n=1 Tax=Wenxinia saemankumensis TaxID=1447782 RepID=A0A1M6GV59_9RHOB|nr:lytic transglycosylase domain-containing protein [Wenxinia saemankumensis]SHJ13817.1 Soluble lytic murein transglycosylase [Wenxinia saemankumensis]